MMEYKIIINILNKRQSLKAGPGASRWTLKNMELISTTKTYQDDEDAESGGNTNHGVWLTLLLRKKNDSLVLACE